MSFSCHMFYCDRRRHIRWTTVILCYLLWWSCNQLPNWVHYVSNLMFLPPWPLRAPQWVHFLQTVYVLCIECSSSLHHYMSHACAGMEYIMQVIQWAHYVDNKHGIHHASDTLSTLCCSKTKQVIFIVRQLSGIWFASSEVLVEQSSSLFLPPGTHAALQWVQLFIGVPRRYERVVVIQANVRHTVYIFKCVASTIQVFIYSTWYPYIAGLQWVMLWLQWIMFAGIPRGSKWIGDRSDQHQTDRVHLQVC